MDDRLMRPFHRSFELTLRSSATRVTYDYRERIGYIAAPLDVPSPIPALSIYRASNVPVNWTQERGVNIAGKKGCAGGENGVTLDLNNERDRRSLLAASLFFVWSMEPWIICERSGEGCRCFIRIFFLIFSFNRENLDRKISGRDKFY